MFESLEVVEDLKEKDRGMLKKIIYELRKITSDKSEKEMSGLMKNIRERVLQIWEGEKSEEMWEYCILDMRLNGKGFEIIKKSKELLQKVEAELEKKGNKL